MSGDIPHRPKIAAILYDDGSGRLLVDGAAEDFTAGDVESVRAVAMARVRILAGELGRPVRMIAVDPAGERELAVHPDGRVEELAPVVAAVEVPRAEPAARTAPSPRPASASINRSRRRAAPRIAAILLVLTAAVSATALAMSGSDDETAPTASTTTTTTVSEADALADKRVARIATARRERAAT